MILNGHISLCAASMSVELSFEASVSVLILTHFLPVVVTTYVLI